MTVWLRSTLFNLAFYANGALWVVLCAPAMFLPRRTLLYLVRGWARSSLWLLRYLAGIRYEIRGTPHREGPLLVACKHQSVFETFALLPYFADPAFILKRELNWIPFFGWWALRMRMIPVDRARGREAMRRMTAMASAEAAAGRQIIIFPEGTRRRPGAPAEYKQGVGHIYAESGVPCQPIALNSGLYWPRRRWLRHPGTILVEFLDPVPPGLAREAFMARLEQTIEPASDRLLQEAAKAPSPPPLPETAQRRLAALEEEKEARGND